MICLTESEGFQKAGGQREAGQSCRSVAKTFLVSVASVVKWSQRQRVVGSPAALKMGGRRPYLVAREWIGSDADRREAISRCELCLSELADRGLVSYALWHFPGMKA